MPLSAEDVNNCVETIFRAAAGPRWTTEELLRFLTDDNYPKNSEEG